MKLESLKDKNNKLYLPAPFPQARQAGDIFHNMNQRYRTRKEPKLELSMDYEYKRSGKYHVLVKVIDILGNDTTKLFEVKI